MSFENLLLNYGKLIKHMEENSYSKHYILLLKTEINWLGKNGCLADSYETACAIREKQTNSSEMRRRYRLEYGILKRFDVDGIYPDYRRKEPLVKYGAYHHLNPEYKDVVDRYKDAASVRGLKPNTVKGNASAGACFLRSMQERGLCSLSEIDECAAMSFFTDGSGNAALSNGYKKQVSEVFQENLGKYREDAKRILAYLPCIRPRRKTIPYLQPEENESLHTVFSDGCPDSLSLRNKAIAALLFFTGLRPCDIASLTMDAIDWEADEIRIVQNKTDVPLVLPLTAVIGNAIYDYIRSERPENSDSHIFLGVNRPHDPISPGALWHIASKIYDAAGIRCEDGDRRGTHLFRYNAATTFVGNGIPRPVASAVLGHEDPSSLDHYTSADIRHLRECALSIKKFPIREGVFDI